MTDKKKEKTFEESMERLEDIVSDLEKNEKPMDETLALFKEGVELVKQCDGQLKSFEKQISDIMAKSDSEDDEH